MAPSALRLEKLHQCFSSFMAPQVHYVIFSRVGPGFHRFLGRAGHLPFQNPSAEVGGLRPPPALMGFEEDDGRFDPKNTRNPGPTPKHRR